MGHTKVSISVIVPALNEEKNISATLDSTLKAIDRLSINGEVIVIDDGSSDKTAELAADFLKRDSRVRILRHDYPRGIGASFWDGVDAAIGEAVTMLPGDNENDPNEILSYYRLLDYVDIIIPFVFNREVRSAFRNFISFFYRFIVNTTFFVNFNYTNGNVIYRTAVLRELEYREVGFFFQSDILVRLVKKGYLFCEVPYRLGMREAGASKSVKLSSLLKLAKGYFCLFYHFYIKRTVNKAVEFNRDSATKRRYSPI